MQRTLEARSILITGAGGGVGREAAVALVQAGARVALFDMDESSLRDTLLEVQRAGGTVLAHRGDVSSEEEVAALIKRVLDEFGRLDGAFNNAAIFQSHKALHEIPTSHWQDVIRVNLTGMFLCLKHEISALLESGGGSIVNTASSLGAVAIAGAAEYIASKHGVVGLSRAAATDYAKRGIRVNAVLPGMILTPPLLAAMRSPEFAEQFETLKSLHPMGRLAEPREIVNAAIWLLSDAASFVTGAAMPVDGGYIAT